MSDSTSELMAQIAAKSDLRLSYGVGGPAGTATVPPSTVATEARSLIPFAEGDHVAVLTAGDGDRLILGPIRSSVVACRAIALGYELADDTATVIPFDSETFDAHAMHSTSVNTSRVTISVAGIYLVGGSVQFTSFGNGTRSASISVNGGAQFAAPMQETDSAGTIDPALNGSDIVQLAAGDYVELLVYQNSGGGMFVDAALWVSLIG